MIKTVIKRDGRKEAFDSAKLNRWGEWASDTLGRYVDWSSVVLSAVSNLPEKCKSSDLQKQLIKECLNNDSWSYNRMAGRLYAALMRKEIFGGNEIPTVKDVHRRLHQAGIMSKLSYTDEEYDQIEKIINHDLDFKASYSELQFSRSKYALKNRVTGKEYETQQFIYMRVAMALAEDRPASTRMYDVRMWYKYFSEKKLSAPTPNYVNLGTPLKGFASCILYKSGDDAKSLAIGDHIAYTMTCMSAGIGANIETRALGEPVRGGVISHMGKLPYYRALDGAIHANLQNGRAGAATVYYSCYDPEIETIAQLKNPMSTDSKRIRGMDYAMQFNKFFVRKAAKNEDYFTFSVNSAPDLWEAFFKDSELFEELYTKYEADPKFKKNYLNAREIMLMVLNEAYETGRAYLFNVDEANHHTPFRDTIYQSNLCFTGDTLVPVNDERVVVRIDELANQSQGINEFEVFSGKESFDAKGKPYWKLEIKKAVAFKTGDKKVVKVTLSTGDTFKCTENHKLALADSHDYIEAKDSLNKILASYSSLEDINVSVVDIEYLDEIVPVYDLTVEDNHNFYIEPNSNQSEFSQHCVLVHNCTEIFEPTKEYYRMTDLYSDEDHGDGEIASCSLAAINVSNITSDEEYESVMYYALLMIDICIHKSEYHLTHLGVTAKARMSAGIGIISLAHALAKNKLSYTSQEGKNFIHEIAERHMYYAIKASLKLGQELGNAKWMNKTKWPEGWLPIDTYNKNVDSIVSTGLKYDWESLRKDVIENGGIRNSVLIAHMPAESSANFCQATNGLYPIRDLTLLKGNDSNITYWAAPDGERLKRWYDIAWEVPTEDLIDAYAIIQKFTDQGISADLYRKVIKDETVTTTEMIKIMLYMVKMGMKSRYYVNIKATDGVELIGVSSAHDNLSASESNDQFDADEVCDSCTL